MAMSFSVDIVEAQLDAVRTRFNNGLVRIYAPATPGGAVPADIDAPLGSSLLLAEMTLANPAFGLITVDENDLICATPAAVSDAAANLTGLSTFFRMFNQANELKAHGTVGASGSSHDMIMAQPNLSAGGPVDISAIYLRLARK